MSVFGQESRSFGKVAVLMGGASAERQVSLMSGGGVLEALRARGVDAHAFDPAERDLSLLKAEGFERCFIALHGRFGEDGTVQGLLELLGIPYAGGGVLMSAIGMNKHVTKQVLRAANVPVVPWVAVTRADLARDRGLWERRMRALDLPVFVKPNEAGSSVGVTKVSRWEDLDAALDTAFAEDGLVLVEKAIVGREVECGVLPGRDGGPVRVSVAGEIVVTGREFYDFEAKYLDAPGVELVCPADLADGELAEMQRIAAQAFEAIGGQGLARVDFFYTGTDFYVNEVNTMPGFTPISMFPTCWIASGLSYPDLISDLLDAALEKA